MYKIRKAKVKDVPGIHKIINHYAEKRIMLPRSLSELYENIQGFFVADYNGRVVACCSLGITWEDLAEIRALAVMPQHLKQGLGDKLVGVCQNEAKMLGVSRIFVLTYIPKFFARFGYRKVSKNKLPHKIWSECIRCPFFPNCKEVPLIKKI